ncbi:MAG TPA: peptide chain release factor N(5)-glutamine methyltransferase [Cyclobacteriaceae bacterium]
MNNSKALFQDFINELTLNEHRDELQSMAYLVFEHVLSLAKLDILTSKEITITPEQKNKLKEIADRLNNHEPVQYILEEALFNGRLFKVNSSVLIPRPETEELIAAILKLTNNKTQLHILDIGTGSGCIPITLALESKQSKVSATDISEQSLAVASKNATYLQAHVNFLKHDILTEELPFTNLDIIVSNPPYIALEEKSTMNSNVVAHEPHLALFVEDNDPLIFYRTIAQKAKHALKTGGLLIVEINERYGTEVAQLFSNNNFVEIEILKDLSGKDRIVKGILKSSQYG